MKNKKRIISMLVVMVMMFTMSFSAEAADTEKNVDIPNALKEKLYLLDTIGPEGTIDENGNVTIPTEIPFVETDNGDYVAFVPLQRVDGFGGALTMTLYQFQGSVYELAYKVVATGPVNRVGFSYELKKGTRILASDYFSQSFPATSLRYGVITRLNIYTPATVTGRIYNCTMYSLEYGGLSGNPNRWTWNF